MPSSLLRKYVCPGSRGAAILLALLIWATPRPAAAQLELDWDLIHQVADQFGIDTNVFSLSAIQVTDLVGWSNYWAGIQGALQGGSLEDLARWRPYAESSLGYLDRFPQAAPMASWLRERMDYLSVAEEALKAEPEAHYTPPPAPKPSTWSPPPPKQPRPPPADVVVRKTDVRCRAESTWTKRLEKRPAPARAAELVPRIKKIFVAEGVPGQLVWLAEVESSMNPAARSPVGAVGLFQLMPATARHLGLRTSPIDERKDAEKNAAAAARYLKYLRGRFSSWSLALAAYNAGEGRVGGLLKRTGSTTFDEIADALPVETRLYVPKMRALLKLRENAALDRLPAKV